MKIKVDEVTLKLSNDEAELLREYLNLTEVRDPDGNDPERADLNRFGWELWERLEQAL